MFRSDFQTLEESGSEQFGLMEISTQENGPAHIQRCSRSIKYPKTILYVEKVWIQLVSGYGKDEIITYYLNNLDFYIVPCLNPDGYEYTRSSPIPSVRQRSFWFD